jgi:predicted acyl esterase
VKRFAKSSAFLFLICNLALHVFAEKNIASDEIDIILDQKIRMRDGIRLSARIWIPAVIENSLPAVFALTPYNSDEGQKRGMFFASNG